MQVFDDFIRDFELRDLDLINAKFTWSNFRENLVNTSIDRFLFSNGWELYFEGFRQLDLV